MNNYAILESFCELFCFAAKKKKPWSKKPKGWTGKSVKHYSKTMMEDEKHPFTACVKKMKDKMDSPERFCGSVKSIFKKNK